MAFISIRRRRRRGKQVCYVSICDVVFVEESLLRSTLDEADAGLIWRQLLANERLVNVRNDAAAGNGCLDERVELLVAAYGELQVARIDALHLEILARVAGQLEHLGREVLEYGRAIDGRRGTHTAVTRRAQLEVSMDATDGKLEAGACRTRHGLGLRLARIFARFSSCLQRNETKRKGTNEKRRVN